ncbi:hypothetical protein EV421DRAFT_1737806 [Armillaria borealis]|uniref:Uncharacterized protein n=1 Tax=Armillaria borealis TaxID=47425 RepID=A0AA39JD77_9AGAR|nr:hypothetical protein EV421DRAFT_1737806 [Armillaria borealis]
MLTLSLHSSLPDGPAYPPKRLQMHYLEDLADGLDHPIPLISNSPSLITAASPYLSPSGLFLLMMHLQAYPSDIYNTVLGHRTISISRIYTQDHRPQLSSPPPSTCRGRGRPPKYKTDEERAASPLLLISRRIMTATGQRHCTQKRQEDTDQDADFHAQDIMTCLDKLKTGLTTALFLAGVYAHAVSDSCSQLAIYIGDILGGFNRLEREASRQMDRYYKDEGCSDRWRTLDSTQKAVQENVALLEDLLCSEVTVKHRLKEQNRVAAAAKAAIGMGLMIEESQRNLIQDFKETSEEPLTVTQRKERQTRCLTLQWQVTQWREMQVAYLPCTATLLKATPVLANRSDVESERLLLPSDIPLLLRMEGCKGDVVNIEEQLCEAQCLDALDVLRGIIRAQRDSYAYRDANMRGQVHMMRAAAFMEHLQRRLESAAAKYQAARAALLNFKLRVLTQVDVTNMEGAVFTIDLDDGTETEKTHYGKKPKRTQQQVVSEAEGYRTVSWIWIMEGAFDEVDNEEVNSVVHVEWLKSRARVHRWHEEFRMVNAEMECTLISLEHCVREWEGIRDTGNSLVGEMEEDAALREGRRAYAESQAATYRALAASFKSQWARPRASARRPPRSADEAMEMEAKEDAEEESPVGDGAADAGSVDSALNEWLRAMDNIHGGDFSTHGYIHGLRSTTTANCDLGPFDDTEHPQEFNADEPWLPFIEPYGREVEWANVLPALILEKDDICTVDETLVEDLLR